MGNARLTEGAAVDLSVGIALAAVVLSCLGAFGHVVWLLSQIKSELQHIGHTLTEAKESIDEHVADCDVDRARLNERVHHLEAQ